MIWYEPLNGANDLLCKVDLTLASNKLFSGFKVEIVVWSRMKTMLLTVIYKQKENLLTIV